MQSVAVAVAVAVAAAVAAAAAVADAAFSARHAQEFDLTQNPKIAVASRVGRRGSTT